MIPGLEVEKKILIQTIQTRSVARFIKGLLRNI